MPRPNPPPTPGSSTDIRGKEGHVQAIAFKLPPTAYDGSDRASSTPSTTSSANASDSSYRPASPTSPRQSSSRKRNVSQADPKGIITKDDFSLPPPPTRSRKIIQMKPTEQQQVQSSQSNTSGGTQQPQLQQPTTGKQTGGGKKKQANGQTAAGRKIARKTAHSLIERRRRSKMNEEFGVLKDMIPACQGQEMHKLAILQASIDYLRYLEQCVQDLKAQQTSSHLSRGGSEHLASSSHSHLPSKQPSMPAQDRPNDGEDDDDDVVDEDEEMSEAGIEEAGPANDVAEYEPGSGASTPHTAPFQKSGSLVSLPSLSQITSTLSTTSPSILSATTGRNSSISSAGATYSPGFSPYVHSAQASPAFGPQLHQLPNGNYNHTSTSGVTGFSLTSPALKPLDSASSEAHHRSINQQSHDQHQNHLEVKGTGSQRRQRLSQQFSESLTGDVSMTNRSDLLDHEASAALLMLNHDRRNWRPAPDGSESQNVSAAQQRQRGKNSSSGAGAGMSVRDLLSG